MTEHISALLAAFIGAIIGSIGAVVVQHLLTRQSEERHRREILVQRYLFQFQDAIMTLRSRLDNLAFRGGHYVMTEDYFEVTTLYALGKVLAIERIFVLEAVYSQFNAAYPGLGELRKMRVERALKDVLRSNIDFFRYDRLSLAESMIEHEGGHFRTSTYLEFRRRYEATDSSEKKWLMPAKEAINSLDEKGMSVLVNLLEKIEKYIAEKTGIYAD